MSLAVSHVLASAFIGLLPFLSPFRWFKIPLIRLLLLLFLLFFLLLISDFSLLRATLLLVISVFSLGCIFLLFLLLALQSFNRVEWFEGFKKPIAVIIKIGKEPEVNLPRCEQP